MIRTSEKKFRLNRCSEREGKIKGKMESERITLESSPAGTSVEAPKQPLLLCREMQGTTVGGWRHTDGSLEQGGSLSLQVVFEVKPDKHNSKFDASCKIVILPMGWRRDGIEQRSIFLRYNIFCPSLAYGPVHNNLILNIGKYCL